MKTKFLASFFMLAVAAFLMGCTGKLEDEITSLRKAADEVKSKQADAGAQIAKLTAEADGLRARLGDSQKAAEMAAAMTAEKEASGRVREAALQAEITRLQTETAKLQAEIARLETELSSAKDAASRVAEQNERGELVGMVTYFFNDNYGYKPDVGSQIYIFTKDSVPDFQASLLKKYLDLKLAANISDAEESNRIYAKYGATADAWKPFGQSLAHMIISVTSGKDVIQLSADGSGAFHTKLKPGHYCVLTQSGHRKSLSVIEISGQLAYDEIDVKSGDQTNVDTKFYLF